MKKISFIAANILLLINSSNAQQAVAANPDKGMGMNVVIMVISIIFAGIVLYLFNLDRKISRLEKEVNNR